MGEGFKVGRIGGFELRVHWSTLVIFGLLVTSLATVRLREAAPGHADVSYVVAAALTGVVFYLSLLAHEVSHAVMARREGIEVESLTLWMLGGVASLQGEPRTPGGDLRIAGIGPAVSLGLALVFGAVATLAAAVDGASLLAATAGWLAGINAVLAVFNLVPAAPLDGGRILRAALWRLRGDRTRAAVTATRAGEAFGYLLVGLGLFRLFTGTGGLWFVLLGWFVLNAARGEREQVHVRDALAGVRVRDVMTTAPVTAPDHVTVSTLLDDYVLRTRHSAFPLVGLSGRPVGLVTLDRLRRVPKDRRDHTLVRGVACRLDEMTTATPEEPLLDVLNRVHECGQGRVLVLHGDRLVGIVTPADVARILEVAAVDEPVVDVRDRERVDERVASHPH